jgi:DNA-directed RNA polymerase subunit RPC12/RpoP
MSSCPNCGAAVSPGVHTCPECGGRVIFHHVPHPHIARRKEHAPFKGRDLLPSASAIQRFNSLLAVKITNAVGTMWCAYLFGVLALVSLPEAIRGGTSTLIAWIAQTFLQLVLLSIIIVGQKVDGAASDKRALETYNDAEAVLHEAMQIQEHLAAQDKVLNELIAELRQAKPA